MFDFVSFFVLFFRQLGVFRRLRMWLKVLVSKVTRPSVNASDVKELVQEGCVEG